MASLTTLAEFACKLAHAARIETLALWRDSQKIDDKATSGPMDPVTEADRRAEKAMRDLISDRFPDHGIEGEEYPNKSGAHELSWTLDPIDGTRAFVCGFPTWTTLISVRKLATPIVGLIDQPNLNVMYLGAHDETVRISANDQLRLSVSKTTRLTQAILSTTDPFLFNPAELGAFNFLRRAAKLTRYGADAFAYAQLASGRIDLVVESGLKPFDICPLIPIVECAGGVITDWRGQTSRLPEGGQVVAAATPELHAEAIEVLHRAAKAPLAR